MLACVCWPGALSCASFLCIPHQQCPICHILMCRCQWPVLTKQPALFSSLKQRSCGSPTREHPLPPWSALLACLSQSLTCHRTSNPSLAPLWLCVFPVHQTPLNPRLLPRCAHMDMHFLSQTHACIHMHTYMHTHVDTCTHVKLERLLDYETCCTLLAEAYVSYVYWVS